MVDRDGERVYRIYYFNWERSRWFPTSAYGNASAAYERLVRYRRGAGFGETPTMVRFEAAALPHAREREGLGIDQTPAAQREEVEVFLERMRGRR